MSHDDLSVLTEILYSRGLGLKSLRKSWHVTKEATGSYEQLKKFDYFEYPET
jgi:hypothetical protein